ncbi:uncharacterized protein LAESUDRAFT_298742 [Laetiporus sulphureus 93-53]|uniref:Uncharacterized protein n=1 Tax=Laetiporus sulphureus 93-53 TaxID=1314785 RepID=A0A165DBV9_9APHY|nr:uncharacterized protein LAESUDRAFT_298742 [Laetiporus sulphureus 93-53]KZT04517.1 hypothetical protein LAESUDRAFT_298742 [Laetiporus sulphureus 93-53]
MLDFILSLDGNHLQTIHYRSEHPPDPDRYPWMNQAIECIARINTPHRQIDLICSRTPPPLWPICFFWTDLLMNVVSADSLVSANPALLFKHRGLYNTRRFWKLEHTVIMKYAIRGYAFAPSPAAWEPTPRCHPLLCCRKQRTFEDRACLRLTFDERNALPADDDAYIAWRLSDARCSANCTTALIGPSAMYGIKD